MRALSGYINGNTVVVDGNISSYNGRDVIVTILDRGDLFVRERAGTFDKNKKRIAAARTLAGLWKDRKDDISAEDMVRNMRRGRQFDS